LRTPENLANIAVGIEYFLSFADACGAITKEEHQQIWDSCRQTITSLGAVQTEHQQVEDPLRETLRLLKSAERAGQLYFRSPDEGPFRELDPAAEANRHDSDRFIGWKDKDDNWWCDPQQLWKTVQRLFREQGRAISKGKVDLFQEMENAGWITPRDERNRGGVPTVKRLIGGERVRVIEISAASFGRLEENGETGK
jgi:hypothetical protein